MILTNQLTVNKETIPSDALIALTNPNLAEIYIGTTSALISIVCVILGIISILLIVVALNKKKNTRAFIIWVAMYVISIITRAIPEIMFSYGMVLDYEPTFWNMYGKLILNIIILIIRIIMITYSIYTIRKNKKENKSLKGEENNVRND